MLVHAVNDAADEAIELLLLLLCRCVLFLIKSINRRQQSTSASNYSNCQSDFRSHRLFIPVHCPHALTAELLFIYKWIRLAHFLTQLTSNLSLTKSLTVTDFDLY